MMRFVEWITARYYIFRNDILLIAGIALFVIMIIGLWFGEGDRRYIINKLLQMVFYSIIFIGIGEFLYSIGMTPSIKYADFNAAIFVFALGIIILNGFLQGVIFKRIVTPITPMAEQWPQIILDRCQDISMKIRKSIDREEDEKEKEIRKDNQ